MVDGGETANRPTGCFRAPGAGRMAAVTAFLIDQLSTLLPPCGIGLGAASRVTKGVTGATGAGGGCACCTSMVVSAAPAAPLLPRATRL